MNDSFALALAGGGTRGAYQVGACKAINEAGPEIKAVTGTSIGALNGCFAATDDIKLLEELYDNIEPNQIIDTSLDLDFSKDIFYISNLLKMSGEFILSGGYKITPLRSLIEANLDLDKLYSSPIDYGMVTFEIGAVQTVQKFRDEIPKDQLIDYVLASASIPLFFASQKIGSKRYADGGIADNLPVNMLIDKGYKNIIAIDLHGIGVIPPVKKNDVYIKTIRPTQSLGGLMDFNKERMKRNKHMGYLDALKALGKLQGEMYFFQPGDYMKLLTVFNVRTLIALERAASVFEIEKYKIYDSDKFLEDVYRKFSAEKKSKASSNRKRVLVRMVEQAKSSPVHTTGIESAFFTDLPEAAKALIELERYMTADRSIRLSADHP